MPVMSDEQRRACMADFMRALSNDRDSMPLTKAELRAAFDALDDFLFANAAAINSALPQPARSALTTPQKARLLMFVVERRYITGA